MVISHVDWCIDGLYSVLVVTIIMRHRVSICLCLPFFFTLSRRSRPVHLNGPASTLSDLFHSDFPVFERPCQYSLGSLSLRFSCLQLRLNANNVLFNFASMRTTLSLTSPQCEQRYLFNFASMRTPLSFYLISESHAKMPLCKKRDRCKRKTTQLVIVYLYLSLYTTLYYNDNSFQVKGNHTFRGFAEKLCR